jgi:DNA-binding response OmpR family regulator
MVTGFPSQRNTINSLNWGAHAYILKPIKPENLLKIVKENLEKREEKIKSQQESTIKKLSDCVKYIVENENEWYTIGGLAERLNIPMEMAVQITTFCESLGLVRYWRRKGVIYKKI